MTKQEIITELAGGRWSHEDIQDFASALKGCRAAADAVAKWQFNVGDKVKFTGRRGNVVVGTVVKRMTKNLQVREDEKFRTWTVPPSMLEKV